MLKAAAIWASITAAVVVAFIASQPPGAPAAVLSATDFSTAAAFKDVEAIAARPHPTGSPDHVRVRDYLLARMRELGLEVSARPTRAFESRDDPEDGQFVSGADLINLVGVMPGRDRSAPALAVMSHYDSVPGSPGAADDTVGVAAALEVARALKAGGQPQRDVVFLITDGEEIGLLGARGFFRDDPLAKRIGAVVNMESRGGAGRVYMFQSSDRNGALIDLFRRTAVNPTSTSLATYLYNSMPNDTDFTVTREAGKIGLNFAFIGSQFDYHAASSTPANLDQRSLRHMGTQVLAATRALADVKSLPALANDVIYADLLGGPMITYPMWAGWLVLLAAAGLIGAAAWRARREEAWTWLDLARGAGAGLYILLVSGAAFAAIRFATGIPRGFTDGRPLLARFVEYETAMALAALAALILTAWALRRGGLWIATTAVPVILGLLTLFGGVQMIPLVMASVAAGLGLFVFRRPATGWGAWTGVLVLGLVIGVLLQGLAPPTSLIAAWPLLAAGVAAMICAFAGRARLDHPVSLAALAVIGAAMAAQLLYTVHPVVLGVGADLPFAACLFVLLLALGLFPLAWAASEHRFLRLAGVISIVLVAATVLFIRFADPASARRPHTTQVIYVADAETGEAWRVTSLRKPDPWTLAVLAADGGKVVDQAILPVTRWGQAAPAAAIATARPEISATRDDAGRVRISMAPVAGARELRLRIETSAPLTGLTINGVAAPKISKADKGLTVIWAAPTEGLTVAFDAAGPGGAALRYATIRDRWPRDARPLRARPVTAMPWANSDSTAVVGGRKVAW